MVTIGLDQLLSKSAICKHRSLENIKKLYTSSHKCDNQQEYKYVLEAATVSTPERFTDNSPVSPGNFLTFRKPSKIKSLRLFTEFLYAKKKTAVRQVGDDISKHKAIGSGSMLWSSISERRGHKKIIERVKKYLHIWILQHHQVVQSPIAND